MNELTTYIDRLVEDKGLADLEPDILKEVRSLLLRNKGDTPVYLTFQDPLGKVAVLHTGEDMKVKTTDELLSQLERLAGENAVKIR